MGFSNHNGGFALFLVRPFSRYAHPTGVYSTCYGQFLWTAASDRTLPTAIWLTDGPQILPPVRIIQVREIVDVHQRLLDFQ